WWTAACAWTRTSCTAGGRTRARSRTCWRRTGGSSPTSRRGGAGSLGRGGAAVIGSGSNLVEAYSGPYTAIGENVTIEKAELEHSIVMSGSRISHVDHRIEASLLGKAGTSERGPRP